MKYMMLHLINLIILFYGIYIAQTALELEWVREFTGDFELQVARDIAVDDSGNVYVGITSFDTVSSYGFKLIKYSSDGAVQWLKKYEGDFIPGISISKDYIQAITLDHNNEIYVLGRSEFLQSDPYDVHTTFVIIRYNSKGEQQWLSEFRKDYLGQGWYWPYVIAVDSLSNVYVGGNFEKGILIKYNSIGKLLWQKNISFVSSVTAMILDEYSNIYIPTNDLSVIKYDSSGDYQWKTTSDSLQGIDTYYGYITMDSKNNIYVNGAHITDYINNSIIVTVKYDRNGNLRWVRKYGQEAHYLRFITAGSEVDDEGNVYVSGEFYDENNRESRFMIIKYDSTGHQIWITEFDAPANSYFNLRKMAMDAAHNIYLIGSINTFYVDNYDFAIVKFDSRSNILYSDFYGVPDRNEKATSVAIDGQQNIFIIGDSYSSKDKKVITLKYTQKPDGVEHRDVLLPSNPKLYQNYPNPFNPSTTIRYALPERAQVDLAVYDIQGRLIRNLASGFREAGQHEAPWDGRDANGRAAASGVYLYSLSTDQGPSTSSGQGFTQTRKLLLLK